MLPSIQLPLDMSQVHWQSPHIVSIGSGSCVDRDNSMSATTGSQADSLVPLPPVLMMIDHLNPAPLRQTLLSWSSLRRDYQKMYDITMQEKSYESHIQSVLASLDSSLLKGPQQTCSQNPTHQSFVSRLYPTAKPRLALVDNSSH